MKSLYKEEEYLLDNMNGYVFHRTKSSSLEKAIGLWPGTNAGCNCLDVTSDVLDPEYRGKLLERECNSEMKSCTQVEKIDEQIIYNWKNFSMTKLEYSYQQYYSRIEKNGSCISGHKNCGIFDSVNQPLCISEKMICPINKIVSSNSPTPPDEVYHYEQISIEDSKYLYVTNEALNSSVIAELRIAEKKDRIPKDKTIHCRNPITYVLGQLSSNFSDCKQMEEADFDKNYFEIDSATQRTVFKNNGIGKVEKLPGLPVGYLDSEVKLFARNFIGFNKKCLEYHVPFDYIKAISIPRSFSYSWLNVVFVFSVIGIIHQIIIIIISYKQKTRQPWLMLFYLHYTQLPSIIMCFIGIMIHYNTMGYMNPLNPTCSDAQTNIVLEKIAKQYLKCRSDNTVNLALGFLCFVLLILFFFFKVYIKNKYPKLLEMNKQQNTHFEPLNSPNSYQSGNINLKLNLQQSNNIGNEVNNVNDYPELNNLSNNETDKPLELFHDAPAPIN